MVCSISSTLCYAPLCELGMRLCKPHFFFASWLSIRFCPQGCQRETGRLEEGKGICSFLFAPYFCQQHFLTLAASVGSSSNSWFPCAFFSPTFSESALWCALREACNLQMMCPPQNLSPSCLGSLTQDLEAPAPGRPCPFLRLASSNKLNLFQS